MSDHSPPKLRVAVTGDFENLAMQAVPWESLGQSVEVVAFHEPFRTAQDTIEALRDFDAVTLIHERVSLTREILENLPRLKLIVATGKRNEVLDAEAAIERNIIICKCNPSFDLPPNAPGGRSPVELAVALLLSCTWHTGQMTTLIRQGGWAAECGIPLRGKTLGILGYGSLGKPVARIGVALGMSVLAFGRSLTDESARADDVTRVDFDTLLKNSDVLSIHLPLTNTTRGMIGADQIAKMKDGVIIINTARASIIAEKPFLEALRSRKISMAGLDVFWQEPLPPDHPLKQLPNVVMTPHIGYATEETMIVRYRAIFDSLTSYCRQKQMTL